MASIRLRMLIAIAAVLAGATVSAVAPAGASAAPVAWWNLVANVEPGNIAPEGEGEIVDQAINIGVGSTEGEETLKDAIPAGFHIVEKEGVPQVEFFVFSFGEGKVSFGTAGPLAELDACHVSENVVTCTTPDTEELNVGPVRPYEYLEMRIRVKAEPGAVSGTHRVDIAGGEAPETSVARPLAVSASPTPFGIDDFTMVPENAGGAIDPQAGSHPLQLTTTLSFNRGADPAQPPAPLRSLHFELPVGLLGNIGAVPRCSALDFQHILTGGSANLCPSGSVIGAAVVTISEERNYNVVTFPIPVFNLEPEQGEPARFGFELVKSPVILDTSVRSGRDYGVDVDISEVTELASPISSSVTIWGAPADPIHNPSRGWGCLAGGYWAANSQQPCAPSTTSHPAPFLTLPTACEAGFATSVEGVSWPVAARPGAEPAPLIAPRKVYELADTLGRPVGISGCNQLPFAPTIDATPEVKSASSPTGLDVRVRMPQEGNENSSGLESSAIKSATVTLPDGLGVNPAAASGLEACSEGEVGFEGDTGETALFSPGIGSAFCPEAAKIGTVTLRTPILPEPIEGSVYLAAQTANPFGSLVAMYIVAENPTSGVRIKLAGDVSLAADGQISASLRNTPQAPIEEAEFNFFGGPHAALGTPRRCGTYETRAVFTPWSGNEPVNAGSTFEIKPAAGESCGAPRSFAPILHAGSQRIQAGAFTPFATTISREDTNQDLSGVEIHLPPGLAGMIASVESCGEAQADAGTCGARSLIGHSTAWVGLGSEPFELSGGQVFLTGPYRGAPFGLSIVTPTKAGPFDLGNVVVRARLGVDPRTAAVTVSTDESGPYAVPTVLKGIPADLKRISVSVDRSGFTFNPTNCRLLAISGTLAGSEGAHAGVSASFQAANCANLKFKPKFTVATSSTTSKLGGASLITKVVYPRTAQGTEANITKVRVTLPKKLPSRLTTLQQACLAAVFATNPAKCPAGSIVGRATVKTPVLPVALTGPAYFVSHGGEEFPSLTIVLQGDNVTVELVGATLIRHGITSTTFNSVPDVPFSEFELTLPRGKFSALTAYGNLCKGPLLMPSEFYGQNGVVIRETARIGVRGCPRHHRARPHR